VRIPVAGRTSYRGRNSRARLEILAMFVLLSLSAGVLAYLVGPASSPAAAHWFAALSKPAWLPAQDIATPAAVAVYGFMAVAVWMIWAERYHPLRNLAVGSFFVQLLLNGAWAPAFFSLHSIGAGLFVAVALWVAVAMSVRFFAGIRAAAALLMGVNLAWASVLVALNFSLWKLNA
jgi:tryptophan-rich sensory protein